MGPWLRTFQANQKSWTASGKVSGARAPRAAQWEAIADSRGRWLSGAPYAMLAAASACLAAKSRRAE